MAGSDLEQNLDMAAGNGEGKTWSMKMYERGKLLEVVVRVSDFLGSTKYARL